MKALCLLLMTFALTVTPVGSRAQESTEAPSNPYSDEVQNTPPSNNPAQTKLPTPRSETHFVIPGRFAGGLQEVLFFSPYLVGQGKMTSSGLLPLLIP
jgi:hypothetical protein